MKNYYWYTVIEVPAVELVQNATGNFNNMLAAKEWTKIDPKDDKILALTTHLYNL